jgi:glycosyltransferase involved in cell wall biosynthesis
MTKLARLLNDTPHDVLYLNSFFNPVFSLRPLLARRLGIARPRPCVIAPRGELMPGALALKSAKKRAFMAGARLVGLHTGVVWQASDEIEAQGIRDTIGSAARIMIAPDAVDPGSLCMRSQPPQPGDVSILRVCFLSRISPKKNLDFALRALAKTSAQVRFSIYGPREDIQYWSLCEGLIGALPRNVKVEYRGTLTPDVIPSELVQHDLFFFPTRGENFGHVIFESLSVGTPVLISDQTPWQPDEAGALRTIELQDPNAFALAIDAHAAHSMPQRAALRSAARAYAERVAGDEATIEANKALFMVALDSFAGVSLPPR